MLSRIFFLLLIVVAGCKHDPFPYANDDPHNPDPTGHKPCHSDSVYFENDILPLLTSNCAVSGCHDQNSAQDGVVLTDYNNIINTGDVRAGRPDNSDLYEVITETRNDKRMPPPPANPLSQSQKDMVYTWIMQGAKNNRCDDCDTTNIAFASHILPIFAQNCQTCHGANNPNAGVSLMTHTQITTAINDKSLLNIINYEPAFKKMPPGGQLPKCDIRKIMLWAEDGMPNN